MIVKINFFSVFFDVESEYGIGTSLTITIFALEGVAIIFSNPVYYVLQNMFLESVSEISIYEN
jgi:hypothetical protein